MLSGHQGAVRASAPRVPTILMVGATPRSFPSSTGPAEKATDHGEGLHPAAKYLAQITMVAVAYFLAGKLGQATTEIRSSNVGPVWPAYGVALASVLLCGKRVWVGIAAAAFLVASSSPVPYLTAMGQAAGATLAAVVGGALLRAADFRRSISRLSDALGLIAIGAFGSALVSASIGVCVLYVTHVRPYSGLGSSWVIYWLGDSTGVLLVTPLILTLPNLFKLSAGASVSEFAVLLLLLTVASFIIFGDLLLAVQVELHVLAFAVLPIVMWAAIRFGVAGAAVSTLLVSAIATVETALGAGPFAQHSTWTNAVLLDVFFTVLAVTGITLGALVNEREQSDREREELIVQRANLESRLRLAAIVDSTDDAIIGEDIDGTITDWNKGAERLYGYSAGEVLGKPISILTQPSTPGEPAGVMWMHETISFETVHLRKGGSPIEVALTISPIKDAGGWIIGGSVIIRDISERKRGEAVLRESEERLRLAAQAGKMVAFDWDAATDMITLSEESTKGVAAEHKKHITLQEALDRVHPDDRARIKATVTAVTPGRDQMQIVFRVPSDVGATWHEVNARAHFDEQGRMLRIVGMVADITGRKQAEEAQRESENKLRLLLDSTAEAIYGIDLEGNCTFCNPACLHMLGYLHSSQLLGRNMHALIHHSYADGSPMLAEECRIHRVIQTGAGVRVDDEVFWRADGTSFPVEYWSYPQRRDNEIIGAVVAFVDTTQRKRTEETLANVSRRLIEAQEQERSRIARELHDDIGQRLALLTLRLEQLPRESAEQIHNSMSELQQQAYAIASDVQLLSHKLHSPKLTYLGLVAAIKGLCRELAQQYKVETSFNSRNVPEDLPEDIALCLFRVAQEALHNAVKHSGVRRFDVELWATGVDINLRVTDHGAGFSPQSVAERQGLGLISMRERLQLVKGSLAIVSQEAQGVTIRASVPLTSNSLSARDREAG